MYQGNNSINARDGLQVLGAQQLAQQAQQQANYGAKESSPGLMEELEKRLHAHLDQLHTLTMRLQTVADGVFGCQPQPTGAQGATPQPEAALHRISQLLDWISQRTSALADEIARVERL